ncbi:MAG TPA: malate synthase A [Saprospiraceae bacterium]|nr:malate synthase A [Saprospiraceae bacterium]HMP26042.1 malate synthase A [Saprospiraceae bacterium]
MTTTATAHYPTPGAMTITGGYQDTFTEILSPEALDFLMALHRKFDARRRELLTARLERQQRLDAGEMPDFLPHTAHIRESDWTVAPLPKDLLDRRVEITGPVDRKMIINALNAGAKVFMADFEDSNTPNWTNTIEGQINLRDAINRTIDFTNPANGKQYQLHAQVATLMVRPRGWHLPEKHIIIAGEPMSGSLVDFGLYFFHNATTLITNGSGPYFYLPKLESHLEARLWNDVFLFAQDYLDIPIGTIKATVLIETILASFELNEILYELRQHSAGLNCGRWDYIFSFIKKFRNRPGFVLPDRSKVNMTVPFMRAYAQLVIQTCHRRNVHAMGGMAAQIPIKNDPAANAAALEKVRQDKLREVQDGHDGTWVAHPDLVPIAMEIFDQNMPTPNQIHRKRADVQVTAADLLSVPPGSITEAGLRLNINVGVLYLESWLRGNGAAAIYHLMEDAATAEISRTQVWQWIHNQAVLEDGRTITYELYRSLLTEELDKIKDYVGPQAFTNGKFAEAVALFDRLVKDADYVAFLTLPAYDII